MEPHLGALGPLVPDDTKLLSWGLLHDPKLLHHAHVIENGPTLYDLPTRDPLDGHS